MKKSRQKIQVMMATLAIALVATMMLRFSVVSAGPVTNPGGNAPFTKLGIYSSVLGIENSGQIMELGNAGRDIASSGDVVLRPSTATVTAQGVRVTASGAAADIYISGDLCLYNHVTQAFVCDHQIASGASTLWQQQVIGSGPSAYTSLEPQLSGNNTPGVRIGGPGVGQAITAGTAVALSTNSRYDDALMVKNLGSDEAVRITQGGLNINNIVTVSGKLEINTGNTLNEVWHPGAAGLAAHEGLGSGLDADLANGNQVTVEQAGSCADSTAGQPHFACVCFLIRYTTKSVNTNNNTNQTIPSEKHCADLANR